MEIRITHITDLAPTRDNRRNSEGDFILLNNGDVLFVYTRYDGGDGDGDPADLYACVSHDGGDSFSPPRPLLLRKEIPADNVMSVTLRRMKNGDLGLFFLVKNPPHQCRLFFCRSKDEGQRFSAPAACIPHRGYFVVNNDRLLLTPSGRWLVPAAFTEVLVEDKTELARFGPAHCMLYASDDDGESWYLLSEIRPGGGMEHSATGLQEPGLALLPGGVLWSFFRTDTGRQYESFSFDDGKNWTAAQPSRFTSPASPLSVKRLRNGRLLAVWNPVPDYNGKNKNPHGIWTGGRTPLVCALSDENGRDFCAPAAIETDPGCGYAYTAIFEAPNGGILLAYSAGGPADGGMLNRLRITKLRLQPEG